MLQQARQAAIQPTATRLVKLNHTKEIEQRLANETLQYVFNNKTMKNYIKCRQDTGNRTQEALTTQTHNSN